PTTCEAAGPLLVTTTERPRPQERQRWFRPAILLWLLHRSMILADPRSSVISLRHLSPRGDASAGGRRTAGTGPGSGSRLPAIHQRTNARGLIPHRGITGCGTSGSPTAMGCGVAAREIGQYSNRTSLPWTATNGQGG